MDRPLLRSASRAAAAAAAAAESDPPPHHSHRHQRRRSTPHEDPVLSRDELRYEIEAIAARIIKDHEKEAAHEFRANLVYWAGAAGLLLLVWTIKGCFNQKHDTYVYENDIPW